VSRSLSPTAAAYPGFFAAFALIALRIVIGWHFFYEGVWKIETLSTNNRFTSEGYLRYASGPLGEVFRRMIPDVYGFEMLDIEAIEKDWTRRLEARARHYGFDEAQKAEAQKQLAAKLDEARSWFADPTNDLKIKRYKDDIAYILQIEQDSGSLWFELAAARDLRSAADATRRQLIGTVDGWANDLAASWDQLATPDQLETAGRYFPPTFDLWNNRLDWIDLATIVGLTACGFGLMAGLFTRLSLLGTIALLSLFYLSAPPFPGVPTSPMSEGHYLMVNKNLVELVACLVLLAFPTEYWVGLDAALFGARRRRKLAEAAARNQSDGDSPDGGLARHSRGDAPDNNGNAYDPESHQVGDPERTELASSPGRSRGY